MILKFGEPNPVEASQPGVAAKEFSQQVAVSMVPSAPQA